MYPEKDAHQRLKINIKLYHGINVDILDSENKDGNEIIRESEMILTS